MSSRNYLLRSFSVFSLCLFSVVIIKKPALLAATSEVRHKRGAVYPASTVIQFSIALAFPFEIPNRKAASNLGVLLNIDLPTNITQLYPYKPESQGRFLSHSVLYDNFEHVLHERGFNGEECILKSICQVAKKILDEEDLSHNLLQVLFRPRFLEGCTDEKCRRIKQARVAGILNLDCHAKYRQCTHSLLDLISF